MAQPLSQADLVPAISVTSPGPSEPTSSPATVEAGDDGRLTPVSPLPKTSLDQRETSTKAAMPQSIPSPSHTFPGQTCTKTAMPQLAHTFPNYNTPFRFFGKGTTALETQRDFSRRDARHVPCHVHMRNAQAKKDNGKKVCGEANDGAKSRRPREPPSFSSPWAASSCSPKRVVWKEVEDYNRQRKRVKFVGWAGIENPWETEGSSTACSEGSDCSDDHESPGLSKRSDVPSENRQTRIGGEKENGDGKRELQSHDSVKVVITTAKDGTTTTVLEAGPNVKRGDGVEIVTKTLVRGDEVMTVTTTTLIPLVDMPSRTEAGD